MKLLIFVIYSSTEITSLYQIQGINLKDEAEKAVFIDSLISCSGGVWIVNDKNIIITYVSECEIKLFVFF